MFVSQIDSPIRRLILHVCCLLALLIWHTASHAAALPDLTGLDSAEQAKVLVRHFEDLYRSSASRATLTMSIETPHYQRTLSMQSESLGRDRAMIRILSPRKDKGVSTLRVEKEMWNYFPKIDKVIKVPPSMMLGSWMGSDFTNDDLVRETEMTEDYHLDLREDDQQYTLVLTPRADTVTLWARIDILVDRDTLLPEKQIFYEDDGSQVRQLIFSEPRTFSGITLPARLEMRPLNKPGHRTAVIYEELELNLQDIESGNFSLRNLKQRLR